MHKLDGYSKPFRKKTYRRHQIARTRPVIRFRVQPIRIKIEICVQSRPNQVILKSVLLYCFLKFILPIPLRCKFSYQRFALLDKTAVRENLLDFVENFDAGLSHETPNTPAPTIVEMAPINPMRSLPLLRFNRFQSPEVKIGGLVNDLPGHHYSQLRVSSKSVSEGEFPTGLLSCTLQREFVPSKGSRSSHRIRRKSWANPASSMSGYWRS